MHQSIKPEKSVNLQSATNFKQVSGAL